MKFSGGSIEYIPLYSQGKLIYFSETKGDSEHDKDLMLSAESCTKCKSIPGNISHNSHNALDGVKQY